MAKEVEYKAHPYLSKRDEPFALGRPIEIYSDTDREQRKRKRKKNTEIKIQKYRIQKYRGTQIQKNECEQKHINKYIIKGKDLDCTIYANEK